MLDPAAHARPALAVVYPQVRAVAYRMAPIPGVRSPRRTTKRTRTRDGQECRPGFVSKRVKHQTSNIQSHILRAFPECVGFYKLRAVCSTSNNLSIIVPAPL